MIEAEIIINGDVTILVHDYPEGTFNSLIHKLSKEPTTQKIEVVILSACTPCS